MNSNIKHVLSGFKKLTSAERKEFYEIIKNFDDYPYTTENKIDESIALGNVSESHINKSTVNFGPAPSGCPCCGKG